MSWILCFFLSVATLCGSVAAAAGLNKAKHRLHQLLTPINIMFFGTLLASILIFFPIYANLYKADDLSFLEAILLSIHNMLRLFVIDGELGFVADNIEGIPEWLYTPFFLFSALLFLLAPMMTLGFVLSFFKNLTAQMRLRLTRKKKIYIFSELNERSISLAEDLDRREKNALFVFTDVFDESGEMPYELLESARRVGAVCLKNDIVTLQITGNLKKSHISFFLIGADESENIGQAIKLIERHNNRSNTDLYVLSAHEESELLLSRIRNGEMRIRKINEVRALIYRDLYENGERFFKDAAEKTDKKITAVIVGMGEHGTEQLKTLAWFCQMEGYQVRLHGFDRYRSAGSRFAMLCPELMDERHNGNFSDDGEAQYEIRIHDGIDVDTASFYIELGNIPDITYVLVSLGNDSRNILVATSLRTFFERMHIHPRIQAIVKDSNKKEAIAGAVNYSDQKYDIEYIGDIKSIYSVDVIINSELEKEALNRHLRWGNEADFWRFDYNRKSSCASALHKRMKIACGMPGITLPPEQRQEADRMTLRKLEHRRWNAYMRSEGYIYSGSTEKSSRNNLGKMHHCLVTFDELDEKEKRKDDD